ncbi:hypothetical protein MTP99_018061 [Tenebrio molitor]|nr:hypothetical protein MTP99_018061 [Tenebrio molitor]
MEALPPLFVGQSFPSYDALCAFVAQYEKHHRQKFWKRSSRKISSTPNIKRHIRRELIYYEISYSCIYGGEKFKSRSKVFKQIHFRTYRLEAPCPAFIKLRASSSGEALEVKSFNDRHQNHALVQVGVVFLPKLCAFDLPREVVKRRPLPAEPCPKIINAMRNCCVTYCRVNRDNGPKRSFFEIPSEASRRRLWLDILENFSGGVSLRRRKSSIWGDLLVCERHFRDKDFKAVHSNRKLLKRSAFPSIFLVNCLVSNCQCKRHELETV